MAESPTTQKKGKRKSLGSEQEDEDFKKRKLTQNLCKIAEEDTSIYEEALETSIKTPQKTSVQSEMDNDELYRRIRETSEADKKEIKDVIKISEEQIKNDIRETETKITTRVDTIQKDISEMKEKQQKQEENVNKLGEHQNEIIKRLEYLEKGEKTKNHKNTGKLSAWQERLREQVDMTRKKLAIYGIPDTEDTIYIRNVANDLKLTHDIKEEMKNSTITFIQDKRPTKGPKEPNSRLFHMTTSGLNARSAILMAAKHKPGGLRFDKVIPHPFKIGYNKQKALIWIIRSAIIMSAQLEIHGHTSIIFIKEKENSTRRIFSEFTPAEKNIKTILNANNMETNVDNKDEDKPTIAYHENKAICDNLSSIIIITGFEIVLEDEHKMLEIKTLLSPEDYPKIIESSHTKYQTKITFESKVIALEIYNKYTADPKKPKKWEWSTFQQEDFKMI